MTTGANATDMQCRRGPDGKMSDTKGIAMYAEVVVSIVREIVIGIASYVSQIIVMVVNCWVTDCKKFKKIIKKSRRHNNHGIICGHPVTNLDRSTHHNPINNII